MLGIEENISNTVLASIDWISFTVFDYFTVETLVERLGFSMASFTLMPKGGMGYKSMLKLNDYPMSILYDGKEDMGIHVNISGSAIAEVLEHFKNTLIATTPFGSDAIAVTDFKNTIMLEFLILIKDLGQLSRLDIAVDDIGGNFFTTDDLITILEDRRCVSRFRNYKNLSKSTLAGVKQGHTVYLGSRTSDIMCRMYDKKLEQNEKLQSRDEPLIEYDWYRWELETKDDRANKIADVLIQGQDLGGIIAGILNNYFRVIVLDDSNRSRCSTDQKWIDFINTIEKISLYIAGEKKTLKDKRLWLIRQVLPTLTGVIIADGGSYDIITDNLENSVVRMSQEMQTIVSAYNPTWYTDFYDNVG